MARSPATPAVVQEDTAARIHRVTRDNRSLWYSLMVLQHPVRARACTPEEVAGGDRRSIDPPPIISLRIIEGSTVEQGEDITLDYNASFFLQANLEDAQPPIASKCAWTLASAGPRPLFGARTSGMTYLTHPARAGYFVFPALIVDKKGWYRLSFSLFEITKEERDLDMESAYGDFACGADYRMEIKTAPFSVYTPKAFPGLMESTDLTRAVSDQGCRLRIRRHARLKKPRGWKNGHTSHGVSDIPVVLGSHAPQYSCPSSSWSPSDFYLPHWEPRRQPSYGKTASLPASTSPSDTQSFVGPANRQYPTNSHLATYPSAQLGGVSFTEPRTQSLRIPPEATERSAPSRASTVHIPPPTPASLDRSINPRSLPGGPSRPDDCVRRNAHRSPLSPPVKVRSVAPRIPFNMAHLLSPAPPEGAPGRPLLPCLV